MQILVYVDNYNNPVPEHQNITEMEKWLSGQMDLFGYEAFKVKLKNFINTEKNIIQANGITHEIKNIPEEMPDEYNKISIAFLELLKKLEYVASVFISGDGVTFSQTPNGFQYIAD